MPRRILGLMALVMSLSLGACDDSTAVGTPGTLTLLITDAPGDFTQAVVTIERIELVGNGEPLVLRDDPFTTDLLTLSNDVATLVENVVIPAGTYSEIRFIIPGACIGVEQSDGTELVYASTGFQECGTVAGSLQLPSFAQTGIKVNLPGGSIEVGGDAQILLLDFDVSESFGQQAGQSGMWVMTPVIRASDISLTGNIVVRLTVADTVDLTEVGSLADFQVHLTGEAVAQPFEVVDGVFTFTYLFLMPNETYTVTVELQDGVSFDFTLNPTSPQDVVLGSGEEASIAFEVTSASNPTL